VLQGSVGQYHEAPLVPRPTKYVDTYLQASIHLPVAYALVSLSLSTDADRSWIRLECNYARSASA
jgi:hypothetical protein